MSVVALPKSASGLKDLGYLQDIPAVRQLGLLVVVAGAIALGSLAPLSSVATAAPGHVTAHVAKHHKKRHHHSIPQHNGGDHDADNNGGPSDGDGNI